MEVFKSRLRCEPCDRDLFLSLPEAQVLPRPVADGLQPHAAAWQPEAANPGGVRCGTGRTASGLVPAAAACTPTVSIRSQ